MAKIGMTNKELISAIKKKLAKANRYVKASLFPGLKYMKKSELERYYKKAHVVSGGDVSLL